MRPRSLAFRLLMANLAIVIVGAVAMFATARMIGPQLFGTEVQEIGQRYGWHQTGRGSGRAEVVDQQGEHIEADLNDAYTGSLTMALAVALGVGALASAGAAALVSRRLLRPLNRMRGAVRSMADGHYDEKVPEPREIELADLADDVNALGSALAITDERRSRLVSDLSHELRTPITSLDGFVEGLEDGVFEANPEILAAMRGETRRLRRLASDLGALSRADEEAFDLQAQEADLGSVAAAAARGLTAAFTSAGVKLEIAELPDLPVAIDIDRMVQVFTNLLRNALQHTPQGGTVGLAAAHRAGSAGVSITDTGEGIAADHLDRVFDRFFRIDDDLPAAGGAGIGLTIARSIARAHGGDVTAASPGPGRGSTFLVTIPLRP